MEKSESLINCFMCKRNKARCGRELPTCSYCSKHGIKCIYPNKIWRRGVSEAGSTPFITKTNVGSSIKFRILTSMDNKMDETQVIQKG
ncbi:hypothetical protein CONCODRAFT_13366 [Conidiobolus coronatus NRRL 28638]|uniref:Zn(2)-C6 fungal-type domain-containing protein n=1 Tax=Conidiobolus coronatus (strain ATCC 28846 / CBS 209.66 / NRRL 28638) TaxID=796925 RepID=A0A137NQW1_CONC2|nr:hypothetical protein CONCODRAFT_13366 [Conidiobolus coronatus NRRL 28638]|eukprot:KXN65149.1 hypothetical protein CONCODRAFT_13366 [Conidiobolus coronatus NRRL 28638]